MKLSSHISRNIDIRIYNSRRLFGKMSNETTKFSLDKTAQLDAKFIDQFLESIKKLNKKYECEKEKVQLKNDRSLIEFQNKFWSKAIAVLEDSTNELEQIGRDEQSDEVDQTIADYHILVALHKHKINEYWAISDSESRKQTILIALAELKQLEHEISSKLNGTNKTISIIDESG